MFRQVTSKTVSYNMDFVGYLISQEVIRRQDSGAPQMTRAEQDDFQRQLIAKVIIQGDVAAAIALRPTLESAPPVRQQLNG